MTVKDLIKVCSKEDYVCVYDIATDTYLYDSYLCNNQTHDDVDDLEVDTVIPCARVFCTDGHVFSDVMPPLHIEPQLYIEVRAEGV